MNEAQGQLTCCELINVCLLICTDRICALTAAVIKRRRLITLIFSDFIFSNSIYQANSRTAATRHQCVQHLFKDSNII